jgi:ribosomal protein L37AE/L43A
LVSENTAMNNRKRFQRICHSCNKVELVRSDQLQNKCRSCQNKLSGKILKNYNEMNPEAAGNASRKHGMHNTRLYRIHKTMMERCGHMGTRHKWAMYYEDRGIRVCKEWHDRETFFAWALSNRYSDELELDRIDNYKGYQPDNCRWVTHLVNMRNRRKLTATPTLPSGTTSFASPIF